ncbi:MAG: hypothetical protein ACE15D_02285 [Candidatus Eisenbacteria bacterium]|nr:hypothetical protein [Candidatus Eisenbacteria bacterium]
MAKFDITHVDRRLIYGIIFLAVLVPLFIPAPKSIRITPEVRVVYDRIEALPRGSIVMIPAEYDPSMSAELSPLTIAVLRQCFSRDLRVLMTCLMSNGVSLVESELTRVAREYGKTYGVDYVYLGYKPYPGVVIMAMGEDFRNPFPTDYYDHPLDTLPMMKGVKNYQNVALVLTINATSGIDYWITYGQGRYKFPLAVGSSAVMAPNYYNYLQSGQLFGLIGGLRGAAEYEELIDKPGTAVRGMFVQSVAHLVIVGLIVVGNVSFIIERRRRRG